MEALDGLRSDLKTLFHKFDTEIVSLTTNLTRKENYLGCFTPENEYTQKSWAETGEVVKLREVASDFQANVDNSTFYCKFVSILFSWSAIMCALTTISVITLRALHRTTNHQVCVRIDGVHMWKIDKTYCVVEN